MNDASDEKPQSTADCDGRKRPSSSSSNTANAKRTRVGHSPAEIEQLKRKVYTILSANISHAGGFKYTLFVNENFRGSARLEELVAFLRTKAPADLIVADRISELITGDLMRSL